MQVIAAERRKRKNERSSLEEEMEAAIGWFEGGCIY